MNTSIESIWDKFSIQLKGFIRRRVNNEQDAEDILQNVFYKIHKNISNLNETDKIHAWIYKITRNAIADFYREQNNDHKSYIVELSEDIISETQDEVTENDEIAQCLKAMITYLPKKYRQAIILKEFHNFTYKELGEKIGLSESGAKSRVQRARKKLKEMLLGCCYLEFDCFGNVLDYKHKCSDCKFC